MELHFNKKSLYLKNIRKYFLILIMYLVFTRNPGLYLPELFVPDVMIRGLFNDLFELFFSPLFVKFMLQICTFALIGEVIKKSFILIKTYLLSEKEEHLDYSFSNLLVTRGGNENLEHANPFLYSNKTVSLRE